MIHLNSKLIPQLFIHGPHTLRRVQLHFCTIPRFGSCSFLQFHVSAVPHFCSPIFLQFHISAVPYFCSSTIAPFQFTDRETRCPHHCIFDARNVAIQNQGLVATIRPSNQSTFSFANITFLLPLR